MSSPLDLQPELFGDPIIDGFLYREELFSTVDEGTFVRALERLPSQPFEFHGHLGNRRVASFGYRYNYGSRRLETASAMPDSLKTLKEIAAAFSELPAGSFVHAVVTEYALGAGIGSHRDKRMFRNLVALSFQSACRLRFRRRASEGWQRHNRVIAPRSGHLLSGEARRTWEHSIPSAESLRYSVTFRDLEPGYAGEIPE